MHEILFPSPFGTPPSPEVVAGRASSPFPRASQDVRACLSSRMRRACMPRHAFEPVSRALCGAGGEGRDWSTLRAAALWPGMSRDEVPERTLVDGRGVRFTVRDFLKAMFEPYPDLPEMQGGRELRGQKGGLAHGGDGCAHEPVVALVAARNMKPSPGADLGNARIIGLAEWWCGPTPARNPVRRDLLPAEGRRQSGSTSVSSKASPPHPCRPSRPKRILRPFRCFISMTTSS